MDRRFEHLLQPIQLGSITLKNRIVRSPLHTGLAGPNGEVTDRMIDYYANAAKGGTAMIVFEIGAVAARYAFADPQLHIDDIKFVPGLHALVEGVHRNGAACAFQLHCAGAFGKEPISPSGVASYGIGRTTYVQPRALSISEVEELRDQFIAAAVRARNVEADGVVLHGATSYLLQQWVSPHTNLRTDRYGGSFENRITLPLEIVRGVRQKCGDSILLGYSLVIDELLPDGVRQEEALAFARALQNEGVDYIDLMVGTYETSSLEEGLGRNARQPRGLFDRSEPYTKLGKLKVLARCMGEHDPVKWEEALAKGQCDAIQVGRPLLCDPELPRKVKEGRPEDIRRCIRCAECYESSVFKHFRVSCSLNAEVGKEREYAITRVATPKRVLVVGAGPSGMEAARVAALRGHEVTVLEKQHRVGGNGQIAALPIGKGEIQTNLIDWLERQCRKAGVKIELGKEASLAAVRQLKPDVVILATGATPLVPPIPGLDKPHVFSAQDVLLMKAPAAKNAVVAGGGLVGIETADFIAEKKLAETVTIVEMLPALAADMPTMARTYMLQVVLPKWKIKAVMGMKIQEITDDAVLAMDHNWRQHSFPADLVVNATGYKSNNSLAEVLREEFPELHLIGDCVRPRNFVGVISEAAFVARQI